MARIKMIKFSKSFRNTDSFPYTADDLAQYMLYTINQYKAFEEVEESSEEE